MWKMKKVKVPTEELSYPCPSCGTYNLPYMHSRDGYAYMLCKKCKKQYRTSTAVSANFRKFCSKVGSKPNRSPTFYTSSEKSAKQYFDRLGYREGLDYWHNVRVKLNGTYCWLDFYFPKLDLAVEISPSVWHRMWNRQEADKKKEDALKKAGVTVISYPEGWIRKLRHIKKPKQTLEYLTNPMNFVRRKPKDVVPKKP